MSKNPKKPNILSPPSWGEGCGGVICSEVSILFVIEKAVVV